MLKNEISAAAIRIFELGLCNNAQELEKLLQMQKEEVYQLYEAD